MHTHFRVHTTCSGTLLTFETQSSSSSSSFNSVASLATTFCVQPPACHQEDHCSPLSALSKNAGVASHCLAGSQQGGGVAHFLSLEPEMADKRL